MVTNTNPYDPINPNLSATNRFSVVVYTRARPQPRLLNPIARGQDFSLTLATSPGLLYFLEFKDSLSDTPWTSLPGVLGDGSSQTLTDSSRNRQERFYRVRVE